MGTVTHADGRITLVGNVWFLCADCGGNFGVSGLPYATTVEEIAAAPSMSQDGTQIRVPLIPPIGFIDKPKPEKLKPMRPAPAKPKTKSRRVSK